jgi:hypothetical protein
MKLGFENLSDTAVRKMGAVIYDEMSLRIGERLTEDMDDDLLDEFSLFIDRDDISGMKRWLETNAPQYEESEIYKKQKTASPDEAQILGETGAELWLKKHRPNYPTIVTKCLEELKNEIRNDFNLELKSPDI